MSLARLLGVVVVKLSHAYQTRSDCYRYCCFELTISLPVTLLLLLYISGVMHLHQTHIIHRDLACRNFLVDEQMDVFVADFGFARLKRIAESKGFTMTGLGPVRWEAPESLQQKGGGIVFVFVEWVGWVVGVLSELWLICVFIIEFSEKTDAFSFGVCMYEIVLGVLVRRVKRMYWYIFSTHRHIYSLLTLSLTTLL